MTSHVLNKQEQQYLLTLARMTLKDALNDAPSANVPESPTPRMHEPGATFVTLHTKHGQLRGCIGSLVARRPLIEDVQHNTMAAAFEDPRFPPLQAAELPNIVIEVSVLTAPEVLDFDGPDDLIQKLRPSVDGVLIERGWNRATFLPQVWEQLPNPREFLEHLCSKAGLPANAWHWPDLKISTYQVEKFSE